MKVNKSTKIGWLKRTIFLLEGLGSPKSKPRSALKPGDPECQSLVREEVQHYSQIFLGEGSSPSAQKTLVEPLPSSWVEMEHRADALVRDMTGFDLFGHVLNELRRSDGVKMLSLGSGPGGMELDFARHAPQAHINCIDINPDLIKLGSERAQAEQLNVQFETGDLNLVDLPEEAYDVVYCHASLHHVLELERLASQIKKTLRKKGKLITVDVCTRNGYLMWPETKAIVQDIFRTLPMPFRINHTAYGRPRLDKEIWEMDLSIERMECIRSQDIIPVLASTLQVVHMLPYFTISRRFFDWMYGPNYDLGKSLDLALVNWIWELDGYYLNLRSSNRLRPETFFAIYTK
jgi:ubiquinone/menaquinone biosynthesis C-methylase UbiE